MGYYVAAGNQATLTTTAKTAVNTTAPATGRRHKYSEIVMGAVANPNATDTALTFDVVRLTTAGSTSTALTPNPSDLADAAATTVVGVNVTSEGSGASTNTYLALFALNQRNTVRWVAVQESQMMIFPTTQSAGGAIRCLAASGGFTASVAATVTFME